MIVEDVMERYRDMVNMNTPFELCHVDKNDLKELLRCHDLWQSYIKSEYPVKLPQMSKSIKSGADDCFHFCCFNLDYSGTCIVCGTVVFTRDIDNEKIYETGTISGTA